MAEEPLAAGRPLVAVLVAQLPFLQHGNRKSATGYRPPASTCLTCEQVGMTVRPCSRAQASA